MLTLIRIIVTTIFIIIIAVFSERINVKVVSFFLPGCV